MLCHGRLVSGCIGRVRAVVRELARKLGVEVETFRDVVGIDTKGKRIEAVVTRRIERDGTLGPPEKIKTRRVINAAGAWSPEIAKLVGVELPNKPHRHEICSTEPLKPWLRPLVADLGDGLYFSQSTRGEIVGGISNEDVPSGIDQESSHRFLALYAKAMVRTCPGLASSGL